MNAKKNNSCLVFLQTQPTLLDSRTRDFYLFGPLSHPTSPTLLSSIYNTRKVLTTSFYPHEHSFLEHRTHIHFTMGFSEGTFHSQLPPPPALSLFSPFLLR